MIIILITRNYRDCTFTGGKLNCNNIKFIKQGIDVCWRDSSMYIFVIPKESFRLIKDHMYKVPELQRYAKILRDNENALINRCTPGGGDEQAFMTAMIKTMGLTYTKDINTISNNSPDYVFNIKEIGNDNVIPQVPNVIKNHKLVGMMFYVNFKQRPHLGHVACAVLCDGMYWRFYNNEGKKVINYDKNLNHTQVAKKISILLQKIMGYGSRVAEINFVYCKID